MKFACEDMAIKVHVIYLGLYIMKNIMTHINTITQTLMCMYTCSYNRKWPLVEMPLNKVYHHRCTW